MKKISQRKLHKAFLKDSKSDQLKRLLNVLAEHPRGITTMALIYKAKITCPHRRMFELRGKGFDITKAERTEGQYPFYRWKI